MRLGLSGTAGHGRSGTRITDYREPKSPAKPQNFARSGAPNNANKESFGFLLTQQRLCTSGARPPLPPGVARTATNPRLTHVTLVWCKGEREDWLRFGKPVANRIIDRRRRVESYTEGQTFALIRWAANEYGTVHSEISIVRAIAAHEPFAPLPLVDPGGDILLQMSGWPRVERVLTLIDAIEAAGFDPCEVAPDHWRHVHSRLLAHTQPRPYTFDRHRAWLLRRRLAP